MWYGEAVPGDNTMSPEFSNPGNRETPQKKGLLSTVKRVFGKPQLPQTEQQNNLTELKPALAEGPQPKVVDPSEIDQDSIEKAVFAAKQTLKKPEAPSGGRGSGAVVTKEEAEAANAGEYIPRGAEKAIQNAAKNKWIDAGLATLTLGGIGAHAALTAYDTNPAIQRAVDRVLGKVGIDLEVPVKPFDPNLKEQVIRGGPDGNAKAATPQQIKEFLEATPPILEKPKSGERAPRIDMILPVDLADGSSVKIVNEIDDTRGGNESYAGYYYSFERPNLYINEGGIFNLPLIKGAKTVEARMQINGIGVKVIEFTYTLHDERKIRADLTLVNDKAIPTDALNSIPTYDPSVFRSLSAREAIPARVFDLTQDSIVPLFRTTEPTRVSFLIRNSESALGASLQTDQNGEPMYVPTTSPSF